MNKLIKALIYGGTVSLSILDTTKLVSDGIKIHNLSERQIKPFGGLLTAAAYMSGCLKNDGGISITVKSDDTTVSVSGDKSLHIRGYIDGENLSGGTMTVIKDDKLYRPFVGVCDLVSNDVSANLMRYFEISEQIKTAVSFGVETQGKKCVFAGGVVMQLLPDCPDEIIDLAEEKMQNFINPHNAFKDIGAEGVLEKYFPEAFKSEYTQRLYPEYKCNCSVDKIKDVILPLGKEELLEITRSLGCVSVHCHYCNKDYKFYKGDIENF